MTASVKPENKKDRRNYGIDLLRIIAGFYIVFIHAIGQGGVLEHLQKGTLSYSVMWALQIIGNCGVDIFILISGYTSIMKKEQKDNWNRLIQLWIEVLFYNVLGYLLYNLTHNIRIVPHDLLMTFMPISNTTYWYFSIFAGFSAIKPILDKGIRSLDEDQLKPLFLILWLVFCIYPVFYGGFGIIDGFSVIWFIVLYSIAAIAKRAEIGKNHSKPILIIMILALAAFTWLWKLYGFEFYTFGKKIDNDTLLPYASPTIAGIAFLHVILFSKFRFPENIKKIIRFAAPSAFAIYILNTHPSYWHNELRDRFTELASRRISVLLPRIFLYTITFVVTAVLIDKIRQYLFKKLSLIHR